MPDIFEKISKSIDLEVTSHCNAACVMCPRQFTRSEGFMKPDVFYRIAEKLIQSDIQIVNFCGYGELLVNKYIFDYVRYFAQNGKITMLRTNGSLLTEDAAQKLITAGMHTINVSVHGITKETYERVMWGLCFESIIKNLEALRRLAEGYSLRLIINAVNILTNAKEVPDMEKFWRSRGFENFELNPCHSRGGALSDQSVYHETCIRLWEGNCPVFPFVTYVAWNGDVLACCQDAVVGVTRMGSLIETSFSEILKLKEEKHIKPIMFDLCQHCDMRVNYDWLKSV